MDQRTIVAVGTCLAIFLVFQFFIFGPQSAEYQKKLKDYRKAVKQKKLEEAAKQATEAQNDPDNPDGPKAVGGPDGKTPDGKTKVTKSVDSVPAKHDLAFVSKEFEAQLTSRGASLRKLTYRNIKDLQKQANFTPLHVYKDAVRSLAMKVDGSEKDLTKLEWNHKNEGDKDVFWRDLGEGRRVEKVFEKTDQFHIKVTVRLINSGSSDWDTYYTLNGPAGMVEEYKVRADELQGVVVTRDDRGAFIFETLGVSKIRDSDGHKREYLTVSDGNVATKQLTFVGLASKYFASLLLPANDSTHAKVHMGRLVSMPAVFGEGPSAEDVAKAKKAKNTTEAVVNQLVAQIISRSLKISPKESVEHEYMLFCGPKDTELLYAEPYGKHGLYRLLDYGYGMFAPAARFLSWLLRIFRGIVGNYGFAILALTLLVRGCLHPLTRKSQISMFMMQRIQPEIEKIRQKYEGNESPEARQKMTLETFALYQKYNVNPVMGCLPMFLQFPIFIALYNVLNYSYELRQAHFIFWIDDLSRADHLFTLPFAIPFHATNVFSVLPIIMIILYFFNTKMQPAPADPKQAEMQSVMKIMLPVFGFLFYTLPSGLLLYFLTSTSIGMAEQFYIKRMLKGLEDDPKALAEVAGASTDNNQSKGKSKGGKKNKKKKAKSRR